MQEPASAGRQAGRHGGRRHPAQPRAGLPRQRPGRAQGGRHDVDADFLISAIAGSSADPELAARLAVEQALATLALLAGRPEPGRRGRGSVKANLHSL